MIWSRNKEDLPDGDEELRLSSVSRTDSGRYRCRAENVEGEAESRPVRLLVQYRPHCVSPDVRAHPAGGGDGGDGAGGTPGVDLRCNVESRPEATLYRWQYNGTDTSFQIPSARSLMSLMNYAVSEGGARGEVLCWARNSVGEQEEPCVFHVLPLGAPQPPEDCAIANQTLTSVQVI